MRRPFGRCAILLLVSLACASRGETSLATWQAPGGAPPHFRRIVTVFVSTDTALRRTIEDRLASSIAGSFPAHSAVPELSLTDATLARQQLSAKLYDGAMVVRIVDARRERGAKQRAAWYAAYPTFQELWLTCWKLAPARGTTVADGTVLIETSIYSLTDNRLLWAARTTTELRPVAKIVDNSVAMVVGELWAKGMFR